jgi:hypothetical protein
VAVRDEARRREPSIGHRRFSTSVQAHVSARSLVGGPDHVSAARGAFYASYGRMKVVHQRTQGAIRVTWMTDLRRPFVIVLAQMAEQCDAPLTPFGHVGIGCESRAEVDRLCDQPRAEGGSGRVRPTTAVRWDIGPSLPTPMATTSNSPMARRSDLRLRIRDRYRPPNRFDRLAGVRSAEKEVFL